ncbi:hypothetical protein [Geminicoccus flavidas]|uniref:hypothetical protein n=1 Tax=Geminicoccus flavidas TaxID=2506407 RepID=UPI00190F5E55|nr:hypothetical protein [Geminicoccus flavidas]
MNTAGLAAALGAIAVYAGMFAVGRAGAWDGLNGYDQTAIRFAVTTLLILPFLWAAIMPAVRRIGISRLVALFVLNGTPYSAVFLGGLVFAVQPRSRSGASERRPRTRPWGQKRFARRS